jgi:hypothetical protein
LRKGQKAVPRTANGPTAADLNCCLIVDYDLPLMRPTYLLNIALQVMLHGNAFHQIEEVNFVDFIHCFK